MWLWENGRGRQTKPRTNRTKIAREELRIKLLANAHLFCLSERNLAVQGLPTLRVILCARIKRSLVNNNNIRNKQYWRDKKKMPQALHKGRWQLSGLLTRGVGAHAHSCCAASGLQSNTIAPTPCQQPPQLQRSHFSPPRSSLKLSLHKAQQLSPPTGWSRQRQGHPTACTPSRPLSWTANDKKH